MILQPIVEGHGEVEALPVLLRRLFEAAAVWEVKVGMPIRQPRGRLVDRAFLERAVELARSQQGCGAILVLLDGDRDCPAELGPKLREWVAVPAAKTPCEVVIAQREYEAWFLAAIESLRGLRGIRVDAAAHPEPENPRGAKEQIEERMEVGRSYLERTDQPALSAQFCMRDAYRASRSFRKLTGAVGSLLRAMGQGADEWPPRTWSAAG